MSSDGPVLVVHGPNLSQLGTRDPAVYGTATIDEVVDAVRAGVGDRRVDDFTSEHEGDLVARLHTARTDGTAAVVVNAGALTHTSHALADAVELLDVPVVEVHLSNIHAREAFRSTSVLGRVVTGSIAGFGATGYELAGRAIAATLAP